MDRFIGSIPIQQLLLNNQIKEKKIMSKKLTPRSKKEQKKLEPWEEDLLEFDKIWEISSKEFDELQKRYKNSKPIILDETSYFDEIEVRQ